MSNFLFFTRFQELTHLIYGHFLTCKLLCDGFKVVFLPEFKSSEMVKKTPKRVISKKTVRSMLELSHYEFRTKLTYYAKTKQTEVILVNEEYTTKCCGRCGILNNVGGSKIYNCSCGYTLDRDYHGARNLCIKTMS
jgi:putative transposase